MSISLTIILAEAVLILILIFAIRSLSQKNKNTKQKLDGYIIENENLQQNIAYLVKHSEEIQKIQKQANEISNKINGAKTDEEISDIVSAIISANKDRL